PAAAAVARVPRGDAGDRAVLLRRLLPLRLVPGGAAAAGAGLRVHAHRAGLPAPAVEPVGAGLRAAAGRQPGGLPVAARGGVAALARLRLAVRAAVVLGPAALRDRPLGLDRLPPPPLRRGPAGGLRARAP